METDYRFAELKCNHGSRPCSNDRPKLSIDGNTVCLHRNGTKWEANHPLYESMYPELMTQPSIRTISDKLYISVILPKCKPTSPANGEEGKCRTAIGKSIIYYFDPNYVHSVLSSAQEMSCYLQGMISDKHENKRTIQLFFRPQSVQESVTWVLPGPQARPGASTTVIDSAIVVTNTIGFIAETTGLGPFKAITMLFSQILQMAHDYSTNQSDMETVDADLQRVLYQIHWALSWVSDDSTTRATMDVHAGSIKNLQARVRKLAARPHLVQFILSAAGKTELAEIQRVIQTFLQDIQAAVGWDTNRTVNEIANVVTHSGAHASASTHMHTMPRGLPVLFGRDAELDSMVTRFTQPSQTLYAILGASGVGKTALGDKVMERLGAIKDYGRDIRRFNCSTIENSFHLVGCMANAIGLDRTSNNTLDHIVTKSSSKGPWLFVLDHFENLWDTERPQMRDILVTLSQTPKFSILLIGQIHVSLLPKSWWADTAHLQLRPLDTVSAVHMMRRNLEWSRQSRVEEETLQALVQELGCLPLAIDLAARSVLGGQYSPKTLLRYIMDTFYASTILFDPGHDSFLSSTEQSLSYLKRYNSPNPILLLQFLSYFPHGVGERLLHKVAPRWLKIPHAMTVLHRHYMVDKDTTTGKIQLPPPLRHYLLMAHPIANNQESLFGALYQLVEKESTSPRLFAGMGVSDVAPLLRHALVTYSSVESIKAALQFAATHLDEKLFDEAIKIAQANPVAHDTSVALVLTKAITRFGTGHRFERYRRNAPSSETERASNLSS